MPEKLDLNQIQNVLVSECHVNLFDSLDSTNAWVLQKIREGDDMPFACFAEQQTQGRGRRGKRWISSGDSNIAMSLAWSFELPVNQLGVLSLVTGIAVARALEKTGIQHPMLKWPNDVLVENKKIAGILIETAKVSDKQTAVVIGVGVNYYLPESLPEIPDQPWTDVVTSLTGKAETGRNDLAALILQECISMCECLPQQQEQLIQEFQQKYDICANKAVVVTLDSGEQLRGIASGITSQGEIRIVIDGEERVFNSAQISLRSLNQDKESKKVCTC